MSKSNLGHFVWHELMTSDDAAASAFYADLFGWAVSTAGDYTMFTTRQGMIGGAGKLPAPMAASGVPPHWLGVVEVADVDATVALSRELGGRVLMPPMDVPQAGRMALITEPSGAPLKLLAPQEHKPLHDPNKAGEFVWNELLSGDASRSFAFCEKLFGWKKSSEFDMGATGKYLLFGAGGPDFGGMFTKPPEVPAPVWMYYVHVTKLDSTLERATAKGATVIAGPMSVPMNGRIVQLKDPQGAMFALHETQSS